ncbi:NAD(P)-binding Rossmann-like domain-containing protein [Andreprevotia lacus DSM 23236]|jgi:glycine/D-amino acid oxidase-like deaminating enzyme|uniref:NAD(P)-binding Rossmann-like domain-containing protein n=1 Tax=Andreprevotia lacus DSM 23236 TaxID=1121001 RepID=A0A1W1XRG4_9NEIS|nr:NAD(P)/FAD-dependent oxidoreductase [Andreprevotia lacus]SMC26464.1 NAD(P)-binding Rossmann-like domain-containing protein [Andreprevotia lacus DSM 23236]
MKRRDFLLLSAGMLAGCTLPPRLAIHRYAPGMAEGHALRDRKALPAPSAELHTDVLILGSGIAGLTAGWRLAQQGYQDFLLLSGPEPHGNASAAHLAGTDCPRGAHYLPIPGMAATQVRELLAEMGVIERGAGTPAPYYDERSLVHAPEERLYQNGQWHSGLLQPGNADENAQIKRFFALVDQLKQKRGSDGKRIFEIPSALASQDPQWRALDRITFDAWLDREGYTSPQLRWYLDYACRDDFGATSARTSAWAGLHYFCSRDGRAANADNDAVLTWPGGLNPLARYMQQRIGAARALPGLAARVSERQGKVETLVWQPQQQRMLRIHARRVICAMPLHVAIHVVEGMGALGFDAQTHMPPHAPWLVSNFAFDHFPSEAHGVPLAWDNVVYGSRSLGYVVATHQLIRAARPEQTVFTAYHALADNTPEAARRWLQQASDDDLYQLAATDLAAVYGWKLWQNAAQVEITVRGHAMASPTPGFLSNTGLAALRACDGPIQFAHSDLSGFSIFEEAAWWGDAAARRILRA